MEPTAQKKEQDENVIVVKDLFKAFDGNKVLNGFNVQVQLQESVVVLGRSGAGKSVLIKCIIGLMPPDSGSIEVLGEDVLKLNKEEMEKMRMRVGFLFQSNALYDSMSVKENLEFPMRRHLKNIAADEVDARVKEVLENVGLEKTINMMPAELSGGMQKRIALARTLVLKPEIILYDEPTAGLDPITSKEISNLIVELKKKYNTSAIVISHDMKCVQITADRIILIQDGKCYAEGTFEELSKSDDENVKHFFD